MSLKVLPLFSLLFLFCYDPSKTIPFSIFPFHVLPCHWMLLSCPVCDLPLYFLKTLKKTAPGLFMCWWSLNSDSHLGHSSLNINVTSSKRSSHLPPIQDILYHIAQLYILQSESTWIVSLLVYCLHHITRRLNLMKSRAMNGLSTGISLDTHNVNLAHREGTQTILLAIRYTNGQGNRWMNGQMHREQEKGLPNRRNYM